MDGPLGPRGVLKCTATLTETPGEDSRFGKWGRQSCEDSGPLTKKRMETVDEEFLTARLDFIDRANQEKKPFFAWFNPSRMHIWTRLKPESQGKTGLGIYPDGMVEHDGQVGQLLKKLDDLGIANNTIVIYTTDNGADTFTWPHGGTTPFRSEKNTNWEGGYRVPALARWPALVQPHTEINGIVSAEDWVQTLMAAGDPDIKDQLLQGFNAGGKNRRGRGRPRRRQPRRSGRHHFRHHGPRSGEAWLDGDASSQPSPTRGNSWFRGAQHGCWQWPC